MDAAHGVSHLAYQDRRRWWRDVSVPNAQVEHFLSR
jgi:hypothetical protein